MDQVTELIAKLHDTDGGVRRNAVVALGKLGAQAVPALIEALQDTTLRGEAARGLGLIGPDAIPALMTCLQDNSEDVRRAVVAVLLEIKQPQAVPGLIAALQDQAENVRYAAVWALWKINKPQSVPGLIAALTHRDEKVRVVAAIALREIKVPQAVPALIMALQDTHRRVRWNAVAALGASKYPQGVPALITALNDGDEIVRAKAVVGLRKSDDPQAVPALMVALQDTSARVSCNAAVALGQIGPPAVPALSGALQDADSNVRRAAVKALAAIHVPQVVPVLIDALHDREVCVAAATALGDLRDPRAIRALIVVYQNAEADVRQNRSLPIELESMVLPTVKEYRVFGNIKVSALRALAKFKDPRVLPILIAAFQSKDSRLSALAYLALSRLGSNAVPALIEALPSGDADAQQNLVELLGRIGDSHAVPAFVEILGCEGRKIGPFEKSQWKLLISTAKALVQIAEKNPAPVLRAALPILRRMRKRDSAFQEALDKIEAATSGMKDLPLPAAAPLPDATLLPRPSALLEASPDGLPIPASPAAEHTITADGKPNAAVARSRRGLMSRWYKREKRH